MAGLGQFAAGLAEDANAATDLAAYRRALLRRLSGIVGAESGSLIPVPRAIEPDQGRCNARLNIDAGSYERFVENRGRYWRAMPRVAEALAGGAVVIDTEVYSGAARARMEPYVEVLIPAGITSILSAPLAFQGGAAALLCLNRHRRASPFGKGDATRLRAMLGLAGLADAAVAARCAERASEADPVTHSLAA